MPPPICDPRDAIIQRETKVTLHSIAEEADAARQVGMVREQANAALLCLSVFCALGVAGFVLLLWVLSWVPYLLRTQ